MGNQPSFQDLLYDAATAVKIATVDMKRQSGPVYVSVSNITFTIYPETDKLYFGTMGGTISNKVSFSICDDSNAYNVTLYDLSQFQYPADMMTISIPK